MAMKAKHAFGSSSGVESALQSKKIDAYDILFLDGDTENPKIGWIDKNGNPVILKDEKADLSELEADVEALESELSTKANAEEVEAKMATKADSDEVNKKLNEIATESVAAAKAYTDGKVEAALNEHLVKNYEITDVPAGTLIDYRESEIRVMCPSNAEFTKQSVGAGGDSNCYYITLKTYAPSDDAVGYVEHLGNVVDNEILTSFSVDEYGRRYQQTWLAVAKYDNDNWTYYGVNSSVNKYIGWDYQIDWYDNNGIMIASDCIRINLSNEKCHYAIEPYYVGSIKKEVDTKIEEIISEIESSYEIIEF